jgi:DNA-binding protein H-NS
MADKYIGVAATWAPAVISAVSGILIWSRLNALEVKQQEVIDEIEELKESLTAEGLADAILVATASGKKDKKDKKGKKDKKDKKDKKKKK